MLQMADRNTSFFIVLFLLFQVLHNITSQQCGADSDLYSIYQMMLKGHTFKTFKFQPDTLECWEACLADVRCQSYNVVMFIEICELNNRTKEARPEDFVRNKDRYYMAKGSRRVPLGSIPEVPAISCKEIRASEEEQAVSGNYWLDSTGSGNPILAHCDMKTEVTDYCIKHRCLNNAKCVNRHVNYTCRCNSAGWKGSYCEQDVNECADGKHVCDVNAECNNTLGSFNCTCKDGFSGNGTHCTGFAAVFTNLGAEGRQGPNSISGHYKDQDHNGQVTVSSGIQLWTVPHTGKYRIEAIGASGGYGEDSVIKNGGRGARMIGNFALTKDEIIRVLVGQKGEKGNSYPKTAGGGGGTFVARGSTTPMIIAGGGGGIKKMTEQHPGCDASITTTGNAENNSPLESGGRDGNGGTINGQYSGGGGGGFYYDGRDASSGGRGGEGYLQGGEGGEYRGGFGGGGGLFQGNRGAGGGGGYSGGNGGANEEFSCGGGGGSFNNGTNQQNECCYNSAGYGRVIITFLH